MSVNAFDHAVLEPAESRQFKYVLITAARNESAYIEETIKSVVTQTVLPLKWIIVSDGSTDFTDEIVKKYIPVHPWIELMRMPEHRQRDFARKAACFNAACRSVEHLQYDLIGNIDADTCFEPDHFEFLLEKFAADDALGVAGTRFVEDGVAYDYRFASTDHVSGPCQVFRRECFEEIGEYPPLQKGGLDVVAVLTARMNYLHQRPMGTADKSRAKAKFTQGETDYALGAHPLWQMLCSIFQMTRQPFVVGGSLLFLGYCWAPVRREKKRLPGHVLRFRRREQMERLKRILKTCFACHSLG